MSSGNLHFILINIMILSSDVSYLIGLMHSPVAVGRSEIRDREELEHATRDIINISVKITPPLFSETLAFNSIYIDDLRLDN